MIELTRGRYRLTLLPETGGAIGAFQYDGKDVFLPTANPSLRAQNGVAVGAYPLIPYSNRIAQARFSFEGRDVALAPNMDGEAHAIHGNAWERVWTVAHLGADHVILTLDHLPGEQDPQWPFAYRAVLSYVLRDHGLDVHMAIENRDTCDQPVGFGFHPFLAADSGATMTFEAEKVWLTTPDGLPTEQLPTDGVWSFHAPKDVHARAIDNCFSGFGGQVVLHNEKADLRVAVTADPIFGHLVIYTSPDSPFVAVEPVTNMTDAIHHPEIVGRGLFVLKPATRIGGGMRFTVSTLNG